MEAPGSLIHGKTTQRSFMVMVPSGPNLSQEKGGFCHASAILCMWFEVSCISSPRDQHGSSSEARVLGRKHIDRDQSTCGSLDTWPAKVIN